MFSAPVHEHVLLVALRQLCGINVGKRGDDRLRLSTKLLRIA